MRVWLAFLCFFRLLFLGKLPAQAAAYLPEGAGPAPALPEPGGAKENGQTDGKIDGKAEAKPKEPAPAEEKKPAKPRAVGATQAQRDGALALLGLLQREGRLVDFLQEGLDGYQDADIGAAVRDIHRGCKKVLVEHFSLEPVMPGDEDAQVTIPSGFDPGEVRLMGEVNGQPPFKGVLRHHGWRVVKAELPVLSEDIDRRVIAPAEVEVA